jgi:hypothetical protein
MLSNVSNIGVERGDCLDGSVHTTLDILWLVINICAISHKSLAKQ